MLGLCRRRIQSGFHEIQQDLCTSAGWQQFTDNIGHSRRLHPSIVVGYQVWHLYTSTTQLSFGETQGLDAETQLEFGHDFLKLLIANGSPFLFANNPETRIFANKWMIQGAIVPD